MSTDTFETGQRVEWDAGDDDTAGVHLGTYTKRDGAIPFFPHIVDSDDMGERRVAAGVLRPHTVAPAPAFPFVGARAQVTVAEYDYYGGGTGECSTVRAGDVVTLDHHVARSENWRVTAPDGTSGHLVAARHLRPVPVSPGPDQPTEHEDWWIGGYRTVYSGGEGRMDAVAVFATPGDAARAVAAVNAEAGLRAEVQRLTEKVSELVQVAHDLCAERDAARAELDAATTDGLGLRDIRVQRRGDGYVRAPYGINGEDDIGVFASQPTSYLRDLASGAVALLRARLADEATTDDKEHDR